MGQWCSISVSPYDILRVDGFTLVPYKPGECLVTAKWEGLEGNLRVKVNDPAGIEDISQDQNYTVNKTAFGITVSNAHSVTVVDLTGATIYSGGNGNIILSRGIYVVKIDGNTFKIVI